MSLGLLKFFGVLAVFIVASSAKQDLTGDYIDLLDLSDNDEFLWGSRENKIDSSFMSIGFNDTNQFQRTHQLPHSIRKRQVTNSNTLLENEDYGTCRTPSGETGHCRQIVYCRMPELKNDVWKIVSQLCVIKGSSIGICCPERISSRVSPQIITNINDNGLNGRDGDRPIVTHAEQRGCGITTKQFPQVANGRPVEPDDWPWMAAIIRQGISYFWCGGVLITDRLVLTAAHCIHKMEKDQFSVRLGEYNREMNNETRARDFPIAAMISHINYNPLTRENDIALIRVNRPALLNTYIWPICLPPIGENWEGRDAVVTGWGATVFTGPHSNILMEVVLPIWKRDDCEKALVERIPETNICAGIKAGGQDSCQGDSGGPLLVQLPNNRWITIGIVSWGVRCGEPNRPGVYTRVDKYLHWIIENSDV